MYVETHQQDLCTAIESSISVPNMSEDPEQGQASQFQGAEMSTTPRDSDQICELWLHGRERLTLGLPLHSWSRSLVHEAGLDRPDLDPLVEMVESFFDVLDHREILDNAGLGVGPPQLQTENIHCHLERPSPSSYHFEYGIEEVGKWEAHILLEGIQESLFVILDQETEGPELLVPPGIRLAVSLDFILPNY